MDREKIIATARRVIRVERDAVAGLEERIGSEFVKAVELISTCRGRVVVTGMGKSGLIGKKIVSTLSSVGTPALYLHPADGVHGDLGMVTTADVVIAISNSGETDEILGLLQVIQRFTVPIIAMTGNMQSSLAKKADITLDISVSEEACAWDLVPTSSTTATLAMGDAIAMTVLELKGFKREDFAVLHPAGSIGRSLLITVAELMHSGANMPVVTESAKLSDVIVEMTSKKLGMTLVTDNAGKVSGIITDGDLRRIMQKTDRAAELLALAASEVMAKSPKTISKGELASKAVKIMEDHKITSLAVLDSAGRPDGVVHLHDLLKAGIV